MPERVETVKCRTRMRKGVQQVLPERPIDLGPGDRSEVLRLAGRVSIIVYRAGFWKRMRARWRERNA